MSPSDAEGDLRLVGLVVLALGVHVARLNAEHSEEPRLLVGFEHLVADRRNRHRASQGGEAGEEDADPLQRDPRDEGDREPSDAHDDRRPQVRLQ